MAEITAAAVKELRELTGVPMMDCKKALVETNGDIEAAKDFLRKRGQAKAIKKSSRETNDGAIAAYVSDDLRTASLVKLSCETDFVAKNERFQNLLQTICSQVATQGDVEVLSQTLVDGSGTIQDLLTQSVAELGENIQFAEAKRFELDEGVIGSYIHMTGKIGVLVPIATNGAADKDQLTSLARDIAMHIAATPAEAVLPEQVDQSVLDKEKEVFVAQARESGKPDNIIEKMVSGRIQKFLKEICVSSQPFVKDPQRTVQQLVDDKAKELGVELRFDSFAKFNF